MSKGKPFGYSSSQSQRRVKYFKFYSEAKAFLKFSWQTASLVNRPFDVCFKNLAQADKLWAWNPNKQLEKRRSILGMFTSNCGCSGACKEVCFSPLWETPAWSFSCTWSPWHFHCCMEHTAFVFPSHGSDVHAVYELLYGSTAGGKRHSLLFSFLLAYLQIFLKGFGVSYRTTTFWTWMNKLLFDILLNTKNSPHITIQTSSNVWCCSFHFQTN